jgi:cob(I)alamin adenosyltransferase
MAQKGLVIVHTGNPGSEAVEVADLVAEMREIKHPFRKWFRAQRGVEF